MSRQEKFSRQMMQLQQDKQKLEIELKQVGDIQCSLQGSDQLYLHTQREIHGQCDQQLTEKSTEC